MEPDQALEVELISSDIELMTALAADPPADLQIGSVRRLQGFGETLGSLSVMLGLVTIPAGAAASLIAAWIWQQLQSRGRTEMTAFITRGDQTIELTLSGTDKDAIAAALQGAIDHVAR